MAECNITLASNGKFLVNTKADVELLGWETHQKYRSYFMEMSWANLLDLSNNAKKLDLQVVVDDFARPVVDRIKEDYKRIKEASRFKTMPIEEIEELWNLEGFHKLLPKVEKVLPHQKRIILWALELGRCGIFAEQGLGKTIISIHLIAKLLSEGKIKKPLVFAPVSLLNEDAWFEDLQKFSDYLPVNLRDKVHYYNDTTGDIYFVNPEKLQHWCFTKTNKEERHFIKDNYFIEQGFDCIIFDESSYLKNNTSYTSRAFLEFAKNVKYMFLMSGTPSPNSIFQIWTQMRAIGSILGDNFASFEKRYGVKRSVGPTEKYFPTKGSDFEIRKRIDHVSYFLEKKGTIELPEQYIKDIEVQLEGEHLKLYKQIEKDYIGAINGFDECGLPLTGTLVSEHEAAVRMKLLQILNGFVKIKDEYENVTTIELPWNPKLEALDKLIKSDIDPYPENHMIIWCRFRKEVEKLLGLYREKYNAAYLYGGMTDKKRQEQLGLWKRDDTCRLIIANPGSAKFGHTWNKANITAYLSGTEDYEQYSQSSARNYRYGQKREVTEYHILTTNTLEPKIWKSIFYRTRLDKFLKQYGL